MFRNCDSYIVSKLNCNVMWPCLWGQPNNDFFILVRFDYFICESSIVSKTYYAINVYITAISSCIVHLHAIKLSISYFVF